MKKLFIIRHAKSSWESRLGGDFDRTLNQRGKEDAKTMADRLNYKNEQIDLIISSPAKRAKLTAEIFYQTLQPTPVLTFDEKLYFATPDVFYHTISTIDEKYQNVAIISHNFGITQFANLLTNMKIENMPTSSIFAVTFRDEWCMFESTKKEFLFFEYPKMFRILK